MLSKDYFATLKKDHKQVAAWLEEVTSTTDRAQKTRTELFEKIKTALEEHTRIEEEVLYPVMVEHEELHDLGLEAEEEHNVVKTLLQELSQEDVTTDTWLAKIRVLKENIEHHVEEEEKEMFPKAEKILPKEQLKALSTELNEARNG